MTMTRRFSLDVLKQVAGQCVRRFPAALSFVVVFTVYLLVKVWTDSSVISSRVDQTAWVYFSAGTLLSVLLQLWGEEVKSVCTRRVVTALAHAALLAWAAYTWYNDDNMLRNEVLWMWLSLVGAMTLAVFVLPFFRERDDVASWNFTWRIFAIAASSWLVGIVMCCGLCLLTASVKYLFGADVSDDWLFTWLILSLFTLPVTLTLGRIPAGELKHDRMLTVFPFLHRSIHYLFLPLLACYMLLLYGYLVKVVVEFQLPDGWVSTLVSALVLGSVAFVLALYPSLRQGTSATDRRVVRVLPFAILPLLVLMTVGVGRRLADYGVTVNRLYVLALLVWFYVVCVGLYLSHARRVWWIPASFALVALLTSAFPVNVTRIARRVVRRSVEASIRETYKGYLPMQRDAYYEWLTTLPAEDAKQINERLKYLDYELRDATVHALVSDSVSWWRANEAIQAEDHDESAKSDKYVHYSADVRTNENYKVEMPSSHATMLVYTEVCHGLPNGRDSVLNIPLLQGSLPIDTVQVRMSDLREWDALTEFSPRCLPCHRKGCTFVLTSYHLVSVDSTCDFTYSGYYLMPSSSAGKHHSKQTNKNE